MPAEHLTGPEANINSIKERIMNAKSIGMLYPNRYEIMIHGIDERFTSARMNMSCETVSFPGRSVSTQPARVYGPIREMPYEKLYTGDLEVTFRVGRDMLERTFFEQWMNNIVSKDSHDFKYYGSNDNGYAKTMVINQLDRGDNVVYQVEVNELYPKGIQAIELGHEKTDEYMKQAITFAFRDYRVTYSKSDNVAQATAPSSYLDMEVTEGEMYYQRVGGYRSREGSGVLRIGSGEISPEDHSSYTRVK